MAADQLGGVGSQTENNCEGCKGPCKTGFCCAKCGARYHTSCGKRAKKCCGLVLSDGDEFVTVPDSEATRENFALLKALAVELRRSNALLTEKIVVLEDSLAVKDSELKKVSEEISELRKLGSAKVDSGAGAVEINTTIDKPETSTDGGVPGYSSTAAASCIRSAGICTDRDRGRPGSKPDFNSDTTGKESGSLNDHQKSTSKCNVGVTLSQLRLGLEDAARFVNSVEGSVPTCDGESDSCDKGDGVLEPVICGNDAVVDRKSKQAENVNKKPLKTRQRQQSRSRPDSLGLGPSNKNVSNNGRFTATETLVGCGTAASLLRAAEREDSTGKCIHVYNLHPDTVEDDVRNHVEAVLGSGSASDVRIERLRARGNYSSFKLALSAVDYGNLLRPEVWPGGIRIRPFQQGFRRPAYRAGLGRGEDRRPWFGRSERGGSRR